MRTQKENCNFLLLQLFSFFKHDAISKSTAIFFIQFFRAFFFSIFSFISKQKTLKSKSVKKQNQQKKGAVLASNQVNGLRCYQCVQGANLFCDEADMFPVACPASAQKCGVSIVVLSNGSFVLD